MHNKKIQHLALNINNVYREMKPCKEYDLTQHENLLQQYDDLVDKIVELTKGEANAFYTDPVLCDDYTAVTGNPCNSLTYNELCEKYGALTFGN